MERENKQLLLPVCVGLWIKICRKCHARRACSEPQPEVERNRKSSDMSQHDAQSQVKTLVKLGQTLVYLAVFGTFSGSIRLYQALSGSIHS